MRLHLLIIYMLMGQVSLFARTDYLSCDFSDGIPADFSLYDRDGNTPSPEMEELGYASGTPWIAISEDDTNMVAASTSWYRTPGTSDDWMVTPPVKVEDAGAVFRWKAKAADKDYRDGYAVYISETGNTPDDFDTANPAFSIKAEAKDWTSREFSLGEYIGKEIYIAFVNNTRDRSQLFVDDLFAGVPPLLEISSGMDRVMTSPGKIRIIAHIVNNSADDISSFTIGYSFGGSEITKKDFSRTVKAGNQIRVEFVSDAEIERNETLPFTLSVYAGNSSHECTGSISAYLQKTVAEEVTGTWCGYCVRGIAAMNYMKRIHPDEFIGIAAHLGSASWPDPMEMADYNDWLFSQFGMSGFPHLIVNRSISTMGDPANLETYFKRYKDREPRFGLGLSVKGDPSDNTVTAYTDIFSAYDLSDARYRLAYVLIENNVHSDGYTYDEAGNRVPDPGWQQNNYYAGDPTADMGGFEDLPAIVPAEDMWYNDVARFFSDDFLGIEGSVPSEIGEGLACTHEYSFEIPASVLDRSNTELCVMLLNEKSGEIVNADIVSLRDAFSGVDAINSDPRLNISVEGGRLSICADSEIRRVSLYAADGSITLERGGLGTRASLDLSSFKGMHIIVVETASGSVTRKVIL